MSEFDEIAEMQSEHTCGTLDLTFPLASPKAPRVSDFLNGDIPQLLHEPSCSGLDLSHPFANIIEEEVRTVYEIPIKKRAA